MLVDNDTFLVNLGKLFSDNKGTIWLTHKRLTHDGKDTTMKPAEGEIDTQEYPCLLRATNGKEVKISTQVLSTQLPKFHATYGALLKASFTTLRKRDKKREKQRAEETARRKRRMTEPIVVESVGAKRGNGRRKRQRVIKAVQKQAISQAKAKEREEAKAANNATV